MQQLHFTARRKTDAEIYLPLAEQSLTAQVSTLSSEGTGENPYAVQVTITAHEAFEGVIRMALPVAQEPRFFLPGYMYGTNRGDAPLVTDAKCARLRTEDHFPASPWWMTRSDRLSHPCALAFAGGRVTGFAATPYFVHGDTGRTAWEPGVQGTFDQYTGFGCAITGEVWYTLGYENAPWFFLEARNPQPRAAMGKNCFCLAKGESITVVLYCFDYPAQDERGIHHALQWVYNHYHQAPRRICTVKEAVSAMATAIARDAWLPENHTYSGFVFDRGDHFEYRPLPSITWTNGLSASLPMLQCATRLGDEAMRLQALDNIQHIVDTAINPQNGLPFMAEKDGRWTNQGWWFENLRCPGHAGYLVGQSTYQILKAYLWEKKHHGTTHEDWLRYAQGVVEHFHHTRNSDGEYPYTLSEKSGAGLEYDSFSGAWCLAAAALLAHITGDPTNVMDLLRSEEWYHQNYICRQECYGGPLDIDKQIDSEGILAYIRAVRYLHTITGEKHLISHLRDALHYEYTFKFCYNSPIKTPPLSTVGWSSCGGSITSVSNPHIHPMSSSVIDEMVYYLAHEEDAYIRARLEDTLFWSCQCHATFDKEYGCGKKGWLSERFCHSEGLLKERYPDGSPASIWFALMPWAAGSLLEGLTGEMWQDD